MKKSDRGKRRFDQLLQATVTQPVPLEKLQKKLEHQRRLTAQIMAILEPAKLKLQVLLRNPNVRKA